ncbi:hypothetical protein V2G26_003610 [Clonostachys chloroleuca]
MHAVIHSQVTDNQTSRTGPNLVPVTDQSNSTYQLHQSSDVHIGPIGDKKTLSWYCLLSNRQFGRKNSQEAAPAG